MIKPKHNVPNLSLPLVNDTQWHLDAQNNQVFTLLVFYRGLHCPICKSYLERLSKKLDEFKARNVNLIAISCDSEKRAKQSHQEWDVAGLPIAYGLSIKDAKAWGLYISHAISDKEPDAFSEPGLFLVKPDKTLYASAIQTMPFARPNWSDILSAIDYVTEHDYPARGAAE
ncbi:peroxiredoxin-like family protein [Jejuia pallidilutea]|jgi:peroxiredoxin|uniref:Conserved domain protein n=1 Tax=Jejuia pallidilutea TaxID=504487 RepID=A0A090W2U3_9FLAO|nr:peroxiredoxin-like family protein [Jejuia pallidilutea]GAL67533.1 conserved domain protein [Jejuia pallidilutea]GAL71335.1 conserved domain protein [Jejuia pallidilutea]GAL88697.1 conserved domain protein [Jejuia pallidilutea]